MADYPHRGPNMSRIQLEGAGGFIYALTPVLILLFGAPWLLAAFIAAGAAVAPLLYWKHKTRQPSLTHLGGAVLGFVVGIGLALWLGTSSIFRVLVLICVSGGFLAAVAIHHQAAHVRHPSIRREDG